MKPRDGLILPSGNVLLYRRSNITLKIEGRVVTNVYRDGSPEIVYDLSSVDETLRSITDYGTYFSVEDAIEKCKLLTTERTMNRW